MRVNAVAEDDLDPFEALTSGRKIIPLDDSHKAQIEALMRSGFTTLWISDHHLLQTHTCALTKIMEEEGKELGLIGYFKTISEGNNPGSPNCFLFPLLNGSWKVYRFSPGINEADTWTQDGEGWTTSYFNRKADLAIAAKVHGGIEDPEHGGFAFETATEALEAAAVLGQKIDLMETLMDRPARLKAHRDGRLVAQIDRKEGDNPLPGWLKKKDKWVRIFETRTNAKKTDELGFSEYDKVLRELVTPAKESAGWVIHTDGDWVHEPGGHVKMRLQSLGHAKTEAEAIMGGAIGKSWKLVNLPFHEEYPGGRQWNKDAAQYCYQPAGLQDNEQPCHPHWDKILAHIGRDLNAALRNAPWTEKAHIKTGSQYLLAWVACMLREPFEQLPYLFLYGPENSGKSIFHESLALLMTKGYTQADKALTTAGDFNGELAGAVLCAVEETNVSKAKGALAKIKQWVTARTLLIRKMRMDSYLQPNTTHWVQCANHQDYCPVFPGDSRITVIHVPDLPPDTEIAKPLLLEKLIEEAPHFMYSLMNLELPKVTSRLRLPVVATENKRRSQESNQNALEAFLAESCHEAPAALMLFKDFFDKFWESLTVNEKDEWTKQRVIRSLPSQFPTGLGKDSRKHIANLSFQPVAVTPGMKPLVYVDNKFILKEDKSC